MGKASVSCGFSRSSIQGFLDVIVGRACAATIGRGVLGSRGGGYRVAIFDVQR
ncbi:hypothetical protein F2Q70_00008392 [Brassica cretica]|uniref:Uncharacterized protein n=1 Tax=Brassica cretica TaxID=69181 RepID=A0A3N6TTZ9_BRACR|nr:hypothetical protein F2Q70_00008392 [Brassica cretica]KAF3549806.1 hypothetical protein DY000_02001878 [Brassica cretica]